MLQRETEEAVSIDEEPLVTCTSPFDEVNVVDTHNSAIKPNTCPGKNLYLCKIITVGVRYLFNRLK